MSTSQHLYKPTKIPVTRNPQKVNYSPDNLYPHALRDAWLRVRSRAFPEGGFWQLVINLGKKPPPEKLFVLTLLLQRALLGGRKISANSCYNTIQTTRENAPMETELETAIIKAVSVHKRLPRTIQKALYNEYGAVADLEEIISTLKALEAQGKVRRHHLKSGRVTDTWEAIL